MFAAYEEAARADPAGAWDAFRAQWNWAALLPHAIPLVSGGVRPAACPVPGGHRVTGTWRLPDAPTSASGAPGYAGGAGAPGPWLVLPLPEGTAAPGDPDLFVTPLGPLRSSGRDLAEDVPTPVLADDVVRLDDLHVADGFAAYSGATALRRSDALFLATATAGMALGASGRMVAALAALDPAGPLDRIAARLRGPAPSSPAAVAAELEGLLHAERLGFTAELHNVPGRGRLVALAGRAPLDVRVSRAAALARHVAATVYECALPFAVGASAGDDRLRAAGGDRGAHPLESLVVDCAPVLQHLRLTVDLVREVVAEGCEAAGQGPVGP
ncbi:hypothetical protein [Streptomyces sp. NPDC047046]|uniref:hypothetical protein n=1 Tax=Streptomyces sp. NPDC047046 TaxID=3155378 RepID=UPI0033E43351